LRQKEGVLVGWAACRFKKDFDGPEGVDTQKHAANWATLSRLVQFAKVLGFSFDCDPR
jgi:hypothetical protein